MTFPEHVKNVLFDQIHSMAMNPCPFVRNPGVDCSRKRKLDFETMLRLLVSMGSNTMKLELLKFFHYSFHPPTPSAFNQQREKILPAALEFLFHSFNQAFPSTSRYRGYRLLAADGSDLAIATNPEDPDTYFRALPNKRGYNQMHLNVLYDLCDRRYVDAVLQPGRKRNEHRALTDMIDRCSSDPKTIFIADRGYESYNTFAHAQENKMYYLIRVKDRTTGGILVGMELPSAESFDVVKQLRLTRRRSNEVRANPSLYKIMYDENIFDYLKLRDRSDYPISLRILRFPITESTYECIITNLPSDSFSLHEIKQIYNMRWGIESSFRKLKYTIGLSSFHSKKTEYISQEVFARLVLHNFSELITTHIVVEQTNTKHNYRLNETMAVRICQAFLKDPSDIAPSDVEPLILRYRLPIREGRHPPRKVQSQGAVSFLYRTC